MRTTLAARPSMHWTWWEWCRVVVVIAALVGAAVAVVGCSDDTELGVAGSELRLCAEGEIVDGIDISSYQNTIDWPAVKAGGKMFSQMRAAAGMHVDKTFAVNWKESKAAGVIRGPYQYFYPSKDEIAQADLFIKLVREAGGLEPGDLPPMLDLETTEDLPNETVRKKYLAWIKRVEDGLGVKPIVYTGNNMDALVKSTLSKYVLWVAHYGVQCPKVPSGWERWTFWQKSDKGKIPGIKGAVDLDVFNGSLSDLKKLTIESNDATANDAGADALVDEAQLAAQAGAGDAGGVDDQAPEDMP